MSFAQNIDTTGCYLHDPVDVGGCEMSVVSVDSVTQLIMLTWHPSPDPRVVGYCICSGMPCLGLDTVWGRMDTNYVCVSHSSGEIHSYSVFAIDSCFHGSPLTAPVSNIVLHLDAAPCPRNIALSWNAYNGGAIERYKVQIDADGVTCRTQVFGGASRFDTLLDGQTQRIRVRVGAAVGGVMAWSNYCEYRFAPPDSCIPPPPPPDTLEEDTLLLYFPNVFTPLLESNSTFGAALPNNVTVPDYQLYVYNRMGLLVYHSDDARKHWDGSHDGVPLPQGVYVYIASYRYQHRRQYAKGTVLLLR